MDKDVVEALVSLRLWIEKQPGPMILESKEHHLGLSDGMKEKYQIQKTTLLAGLEETTKPWRVIEALETLCKDFSRLWNKYDRDGNHPELTDKGNYAAELEHIIMNVRDKLEKA